MAKVELTSDARVLVGIDISKHRHEVLIAIPGKTRRRRLTITNSTDDFMRLIAGSTEDGQLFHAIMGTDSTASWAAVPRVGQCDRRVSSGQVLRPWSRDFAAILRMLSPVSLRRCAL